MQVVPMDADLRLLLSGRLATAAGSLCFTFRLALESGWNNGGGWEGHHSKGKGHGLSYGRGPSNDGTAAGLMGFMMSTAQNAIAGVASKHIEK